jgi:hypothetical protein
MDGSSCLAWQMANINYLTFFVCSMDVSSIFENIKNQLFDVFLHFYDILTFSMDVFSVFENIKNQLFDIFLDIFYIMRI